MAQKNPPDECDFGRLFTQFQPRIYGYIRSMIPNRGDAEDLLQETASVLWRKFDDFRPGSSFLAWALQVARFQILYFWQRQERNVLHFSEQFLDIVGVETARDASEWGDLQELLEKCMGKLPVPDRELFELRYRSDLPTKHLAERIGRPASTVYDAINRIRKRLVDCVGRAINRLGRGGAAAEAFFDARDMDIR